MTQKNNDFIIFGAPDIQAPEVKEVEECLASRWLGTGPRVSRFETDFAEYIHSNNCVALNSCTAALHLSLIAAEVCPGDEVITTPMTFCATINSIIHAGGTPVLVDVEPDSMNISASDVAAHITDRTRAILPVHFAGRPCDIEALCQIADENSIKVIEDCAHAIEAQVSGRSMGTFGDFGCFSFYVTKNVTTGEGGMVAARRSEDTDRIKTLALHGMTKDAWKRFGDSGYKHYQVVEPGFKYNMMDLQAAIGIHQLARIEQSLLRREAIWKMYDRAFADFPVKCPAQPSPGTRHARHLYTLQIDEHKCGVSRDSFLNDMTKFGVGVGVHYMSIPEHPFYQAKFGWRVEQFPNAMKIGRETVSLPLSSCLTDEEVDRVISAVGKVLATV